MREVIKIVLTFDNFSNKMLAMPVDLVQLLNYPSIISIRNWRNVTNLLVNYKNVLWMMVLVCKTENV